MYLVYVLCVKDQGRTKDEPRNTERTPKLKKVLFLRLCPFNGLVLAAIPASFPPFPSGHSSIAGTAVPLPLCYLALAAIPASSLPVTLVHLVLPFPFLLAVLLCGVPDNACGVFGCVLRFRPQDSPRLYTLHSTPYTAAPPPPLN